MNWKKKRVIVTGGAGFIGQNLIQRLIFENADITVIDNFAYSAKDNLLPFRDSIRIIESDVRSKHLTDQLDGKYNFIFHFAAPSSVILFEEDPLNTFSATTAGLINLMNLAVEKNVEKVIYPSSGSVYGKCSLPNSENSIVNPSNLYGVAKISCEKIAALYASEVESVGLRIFAGYGMGERHKGKIASPVSLFLNSIAVRKSPLIYGDGNQSRDFVYIDDVVEAILKSAELDNLPPIINVGSGISYSFNEVVDLINRNLEKQVFPIYVEKPAKYLERTQADMTLLYRSLSVEPRDLEKGLQDYIEAAFGNSEEVREQTIISEC
jgi:UDP-glucose 4-epimerase